MKTKQDARQLTHVMLTEIRKRAVQSVQNGESPEVVARAIGIHRGTIYGWLALYRNGGWDALDAAKRGGRPPKLNAKALAWLYRTITNKDPRQLKFQFALWTSRMIGQLILQRYGIKLSKASICRLLGQLGLTPQRPLWQAYQQNPKEVERWLKKRYPAIKGLGKKLKALIYFGDEAGVRSDDHAGCTWGIKGKTPKITTSGVRFGMNMISAVSTQGEFRFMVVQDKIKTDHFIEFMQRLIHKNSRMVFLIVDNHPIHKSRKVNKFLKENDERIRLYLLPPYSPELNPDELVWNDLKNNGVGRQVHNNKEELHRNIIKYLRSIQKRTDRVKSYFRSPTTRYAI